MLATTSVAIVLLSVFSVRGDDLLSKFHQSAYKIKEYRAEVISYDQNYISIFQIKTFKYNRTTIAINVTVKFTKDISMKNLELLVQGYKQASNEYRRFQIRFQKNAGIIVLANILGLQSIFACGNATLLDIYKKDVIYHICNFVPDDRLLPPLVPTGQYKGDIRLLYPEKEIGAVAGYVEIFIPFKYK